MSTWVEGMADTDSPADGPECDYINYAVEGGVLAIELDRPRRTTRSRWT